MYSLFVTNKASEKFEGTFIIERERFLEYTAELLKTQLETLSTEAVQSICSWPCILMQEGRGQEPATVVKVSHLDGAGKQIKATINRIVEAPSILNSALWRLRDDLDIAEFEFNRHHWAIKDRDLIVPLARAGHPIHAAFSDHFEDAPLPAPPRPELLNARNAMAAWSHTQIDDFLLEAGVNELAAERALGSRHDRANAILQYVLGHPSATTAENSLLSAFLVRRAIGRGNGGTASRPETRPQAAADSPVVAAPTTKPSEGTRSPNRVFVVHGQNQTARDKVVSFLEAIGLRGIVLHEQPNMGRHLLTKFIEEAELVTFAIVLMTDDDVGALRGEALLPRARQNVILELGYFLSHLSQRKVCALITPGLETPSDFDGIVYIKMDEGGSWKTELKRELLAADMPLIDRTGIGC